MVEMTRIREMVMMERKDCFFMRVGILLFCPFSIFLVAKVIMICSMAHQAALATSIPIVLEI